MKIFVAGATGVLGRRLVHALALRGHEVVGLVRSAPGAATVREAGGTPARASLFDIDQLARAMRGAEVVVHAATAIPTGSRGSPAAWATNDRIRREGTRALTAAAARVGARRYLQQSVVWVVRTPGGAPFDESTPPDPSPVALSALDGERIAREAGALRGFSVGVLRCGAFYGADTAHTRILADLLRRRRLPVVGRGDAILAPLHADDAASAFVAAAEGGISGTWHVVDDEPVPFRTFLHAFAELLGAPAPRRVPRWLAGILADSASVDAMSTSMNTSNARFRREFDWAPRFPSYREGLTALVSEWRSTGAATDPRLDGRVAPRPASRAA